MTLRKFALDCDITDKLTEYTPETSYLCSAWAPSATFPSPKFQRYLKSGIWFATSNLIISFSQASDLLELNLSSGSICSFIEELVVFSSAFSLTVSGFRESFRMTEWSVKVVFCVLLSSLLNITFVSSLIPFSVLLSDIKMFTFPLSGCRGFIE